MFHDILVAVDGSPAADQALAQAIDLAEREHSRLTLITGVPAPPSIAYVGMSGVVLPDLEADAHAWASAVLQRARDRVPGDLPVTTIVTDEPIRAALIEQIRRGGMTCSSWAHAAAARCAPPCSAASATTCSITARLVCGRRVRRVTESLEALTYGLVLGCRLIARSGWTIRTGPGVRSQLSFSVKSSKGERP